MDRTMTVIPQEMNMAKAEMAFFETTSLAPAAIPTKPMTLPQMPTTGQWLPYYT